MMYWSHIKLCLRNIKALSEVGWELDIFVHIQGLCPREYELTSIPKPIIRTMPA
jgi:hypothetical protein